MSETKDLIWSDTDIPYMCLVDIKRTEAFRKAIQQVVKPGSVVVDIGSGTGIFALFAAEAGASKVYAVEIEHQLATCIRQSVEVSQYKDIIEVVEGDALEANLPENIDVVIAEIIETGLMDEMQVPVMNALHQKGIIGPDTKVIPQRYQTNLELVNVNDTFYGHVIKAPKHIWPHYGLNQDEWAQAKVTVLSSKVTTVDLNLEKDVNDVNFDKTLSFTVQASDKPINAVLISGLMTLTDGIEMREGNSVNGDKILSLPKEITANAGQVDAHITYKMGAGLGTFKFEIA